MAHVYTIGYATRTLETFIALLKQHRVVVVADVRSVPYSQYHSEFNRENFQAELKSHRMRYVFLGDQCGARTSDRNCYRNGKVDFGLLAMTPIFQNGLERIINGAQTYRIALMCAELDPITCHRAILICKHLKSSVKVDHILNDCELEHHADFEKRLLKIFGMDQSDLFMSADQQLEQAYQLQAEKIAYSENDKSEEGQGNEWE
jgi:uncharacterized protein (DUF488 family)